MNTTSTGAATAVEPDVKASGLVVLSALGVLIGLRLLFRKIAD